MTNESERELRAHWDARYRSGQTPWDTGITPPEVQQFWQEHSELAAGSFSIDIGCGTGLNTLFLARQGLRAVGIDLSGQALQHAKRRLDAHLREAAFPMGGTASFVQADVSRLPIDRPGAAYALDIGCLHSLPDARRAAYAEGVCRVLREGGYYHLYVFDRDPTDGPGARGMYEGEVASLFGSRMAVVTEEKGISSTRASRPSRWFLLRRGS